jgi:hypothetical protein
MASQGLESLRLVLLCALSRSPRLSTATWYGLPVAHCGFGLDSNSRLLEAFTGTQGLFDARPSPCRCSSTNMGPQSGRCDCCLGLSKQIRALSFYGKASCGRRQSSDQLYFSVRHAAPTRRLARTGRHSKQLRSDLVAT